MPEDNSYLPLAHNVSVSSTAASKTAALSLAQTPAFSDSASANDNTIQ